VKHLKSYKLFESVEVSKTMIEDFLREFSDNDIRVDVELYIKPGGDFSKNNASQVNIVRMLSPQEQVKEFREFSEFLEDVETSDKKSYKMVEFFYKKS